MPISCYSSLELPVLHVLIIVMMPDIVLTVLKREMINLSFVYFLIGHFIIPFFACNQVHAITFLSACIRATTLYKNLIRSALIPDFSQRYHYI